MKMKAALISCGLISGMSAAMQQADAQGLGEFGGMQALGIGMGAGLATVDHGKLAKYAVNSAAQAQQTLAAQTKAIEQYYALGNKYEAEKQWENAEKCFAYTLQIIAKRDGPGSPKSVPTLRHLATVTVAQDKLDQASSYEKTVLAFTKAGKHSDKVGVLKESVKLSNLLVKKSKYVTAEPILKDSIAVAQSGNIKTPDYRSALVMYNLVLQELNKPDEAAVVAAQISKEDSAQETASTNSEKASQPSADASLPAPTAAASGSPAEACSGAIPDSAPPVAVDSLPGTPLPVDASAISVKPAASAPAAVTTTAPGQAPVPAESPAAQATAPAQVPAQVPAQEPKPAPTSTDSASVSEKEPSTGAVSSSAPSDTSAPSPVGEAQPVESTNPSAK